MTLATNKFALVLFLLFAPICASARLLDWIDPNFVDPKTGKTGDGSGNGAGAGANGQGSSLLGGALGSGADASKNKNKGKSGNDKGSGQGVSKVPEPSKSGGSDGPTDRGGRPGDHGGNGDGGGGPPPNETKKPPFWIPICWLAAPNMPANEINDIVKGNVDAYGGCGIAVAPFVFRVKSIPHSEKQINDLATKVCPLNSVFKVGGAAVQTLSPWDDTADEMCANRENGKLLKDVAGCSVVGNGKSGKSPSEGFEGKGSYGSGGNKGGTPATSIVDQEAWKSPGVAYHELGHSNGGPGLGGDFLVNVGEGVPNPKGTIPKQALMGLEAMSMGGDASRDSSGGGKEGSGVGGKIVTNQFACDSLKGGSNPNKEGYRWNPKNKVYFSDKPGDPIKWDLMAGQSFFDQKKPPPGAPPNNDKLPPGGDRGGDLVLRDKANPELQPDTGGHKLKKTGGGNAGQASSINSIRNGGRGTPLDQTVSRPAPPPPPPPGGKDGAGTIVLTDVGGGNGPSGVSSVTNGAPGANGPPGANGAAGDGGAAGNLVLSNGEAGAGGTSSVGSSSRNPRSGLEKTKTDLDDSFFSKIQQDQKREKRKKGSTLRGNGARGESARVPAQSTPAVKPEASFP